MTQDSESRSPLEPGKLGPFNGKGVIEVESLANGVLPKGAFEVDDTVSEADVSQILGDSVEYRGILISSTGKDRVTVERCYIDSPITTFPLLTFTAMSGFSAPQVVKDKEKPS